MGGRLVPSRYGEIFSDLHPLLSLHEAGIEAERCYFCHDAPCMAACPTGIDIALFIRQIQAGNPKGAATTIFSENILGGMCARVCPTETLCEEACVRNAAEGEPVTIGRLQRFATDHAMALGTQPFERGPDSGKKIAVVGAGPAGLACAHRLAVLGHSVTIFEAREKPGGLSEYGIAAYKTVDDFAQREVEFILSIGGITVENGRTFGHDLALAELREAFDAVFLGVGLGGVNGLGIDGEDLIGVRDAVEFIAELRQVGDLAEIPVGRRVVVIGGGMTAIDAAVQARLLGAEEVTIAYRRGRDAMNASEFEQHLAQTRGVAIRENLQPLRIVAGDAEADQNVAGIEMEYTATAGAKLEGTGEVIVLNADMVLKAIGQSFVVPGSEAVGAFPDLERGRIKVDGARRTSVAGVWAGGDCVAGGDDLTVSAVEDGKIAAGSIDAILRD